MPCSLACFACSSERSSRLGLELISQNRDCSKEVGFALTFSSGAAVLKQPICLLEEPAMGPGEYLPDRTEGITRVEDLPTPVCARRSRNYRHRPCPRCGRSCFRNGRGRRTLHDLGFPLRDR